MIRSLKNDNYLVMETEAQGFPGWTPYKGQLRQQAYSHLASGANSVMYWHWHSIHNTLWHHNFPCGLSKPKKEACLFFQTRFFFCMLFYILFCFVSFLLNCLKCLIQILDDIVDVLGTDGKTDGVWFDSLI